ncbi:hypothetical protein [Thiolapillus sp.]
MRSAWWPGRLGHKLGCQRPSRFWGLGCPKIYHEAEDTLASVECCK